MYQLKLRPGFPFLACLITKKKKKQGLVFSNNNNRGKVVHIFNEQEIERHLGVQLSLTSQSEKLIEVEVTNFPPTYKKKGYH